MITAINVTKLKFGTGLMFVVNHHVSRLYNNDFVNEAVLALFGTVGYRWLLQRTLIVCIMLYRIIF